MLEIRIENYKTGGKFYIFIIGVNLSDKNRYKKTIEKLNVEGVLMYIMVKNAEKKAKKAISED